MLFQFCGQTIIGKKHLVCPANPCGCVHETTDGTHIGWKQKDLVGKMVLKSHLPQHRRKTHEVRLIIIRSF